MSGAGTIDSRVLGAPSRPRKPAGWSGFSLTPVQQVCFRAEVDAWAGRPAERRPGVPGCFGLCSRSIPPPFATSTGHQHSVLTAMLNSEVTSAGKYQAATQLFAN